MCRRGQLDAFDGTAHCFGKGGAHFFALNGIRNGIPKVPVSGFAFAAPGSEVAVIDSTAIQDGIMLVQDKRLGGPARIKLVGPVLIVHDKVHLQVIRFSEDIDLVLAGGGVGKYTEKLNRGICKFSFELPQVVTHVLTNGTQRSQEQNHA